MRLTVPGIALLFGVNLLFSSTPLIKSTDGGLTWIDIDPGQPHQGIVDLQITSNGSRLYALTVTQFRPGPSGAWLLDRSDFSVLSSYDGGRTWVPLDPLRVTGVRTAKLAVAASDPQTVYIGYEDTDLNAGPQCGQIFPFSWSLRKSTDGGRTASRITGINEVLRAMEELRTDPKTYYPNLYCFTGALAVHPAISTTIFAELLWVADFDGVYSGSLSSADGGQNWRLSSKVGLTKLLADPAEPSTLYAQHEDLYENPYAPKTYLAKSTDGGNEWSFKLSDVSSFALDPHDPAILLASRTDGSLWKSTDRAETWQHLANSLPFDRIVIHPAKPPLSLPKLRLFTTKASTQVKSLRARTAE